MRFPYPSDGFKKQLWISGSWTGVIFLLLQVQILLAQTNPIFEASIDAREVIVGVPFELSFSLKNAEGTRFSPPPLTGFKSSAISEMRGASIINGRSSISQTWSVGLTPMRPGTYSIGPATVISNGRTLSTQALSIQVLSAPKSQNNVNLPPGSDDRVFIAGDFDRKEAYVGQQVTWRIRLYTQLSIEGYDIISLPDFEGFFSKEKIRFDKRVEYLNLRGKKYAVQTLHEFALFPQKTGKIVVNPARISVGVEQPGTQGFLFGPKPVTLQTQTNELIVNALPQPSPEEFTGGVGHYEWTVKADTNYLTTDDALTLIIEVKGNGDARRFAAPKIAVPTNCEIFEPRILEEEEYESEMEILHRKKFEYVVLPKDTGYMEINPVMSYFDLDSNRYHQLRSGTIRMTVTAGKNYQSPSISALPTVLPPPPDPGLLEKIWDWLYSPVLWSVLALPFVGLGVFMLLKRRKNSPQPPINQSTNQPVNRPTNQPLNKPTKPPITRSAALDRFAKAGLLLSGEPKPFYDELFKSLQAWLSARLGLQPAQMNDIEITKALQLHGATPIRTQALLSVWHSCEQAIYGGQDQAGQMESTWQLAGQVIDALEKELH